MTDPIRACEACGNDCDVLKTTLSYDFDTSAKNVEHDVRRTIRDLQLEAVSKVRWCP